MGRPKLTLDAALSTAVAPAADFEQVLASSRTRLFRTALLLLGSREEAEDATQRTILKALESRSRFRAEAGVYTWLHCILVNHARDLWKHRKRASRWLAPADEREIEAVATPEPDAEQSLLQKQRDRAVCRALDTLEPASREVLVLRHYQELSYEQIADVLGCPVGTVRSRLSTARERLRQRLAAEEAVR